MPHVKIDDLHLSASDKSTLQEFVASWGRHRHPVLFVGAGLSKFESERKRDVTGKSAFGSWWDLIADLQHALTGGNDKVREKLPADPLRLAQVYQTQFSRTAVLDLIAKHVPSGDFLPGAAHYRLRDIPWSAVVTTNYDDLLERAFDPVRRARVIISDEDLTQHRTMDDLLIIKMHGDLRRRDSIVISEEDYRQYAVTRPGISVKVRQLLVEHPLLFLGFSLNDPHFATIDGWIRDTMRSVRLPAVSIMHDDAIPAAYSMWKARGVELLRLNPANTLSQLLEALAVEARPRESNAQVANRRVTALEDEARKVAQERGPTAAKDLANLISEIVTGAKNDLDGGKAARTAILWFCAGWHNVLRADTTQPQFSASKVAPTSANRVSLREVFVHFGESARRHVLMFALEAGHESVKLDPTTTLMIQEDLLKGVATSDELASIHLYSARIFRASGRTREAQNEIALGRQKRPSKRIASLLSAEIREILFQDGDASKIEAELRLPPDEDTDIFALCRRGADLLLLGFRDQALVQYSNALEQANNGDEVHSALWGKLASLREALSSSPTFEQEEEELEKLRAIPDNQKPRSTAAQELLDEAGSALLDGNHRKTAIDNLLEYLREARYLGWPHSPYHDIAYHIEGAAYSAARLLMQEEEVHSIKESLALLCRYGLANKVRELFCERQREFLAMSERDVDWFRQFSAERPTLPRAADARFSVMLCGIPLLEDRAIEAAIFELIARTASWHADQQHDDMIGTWWEIATGVSEHLTEKAVRSILSALELYMSDRDALFYLRPSRLSPRLWKEQGHISRGGPEMQQLVRAADGALANIEASKHPLWIVEFVDFLSAIVLEDLFDESECAKLIPGARGWLASLLALVPVPQYDVLQVVWLIDCLAAPDGAQYLGAFTPYASAIAIDGIRSSAAPLALHCARTVLGEMSHQQRDELLSAVIIEAENVIAHRAEVRNAGHLARILVDLERFYVSRREEFVSLVTRLAQRDIRALPSFSALQDLSREHVARAANLASRALFSAAADRAKCLQSIAVWLAAPAASTANDLVGVIVGLCASESVDVRISALAALRGYFRAHPESAGEYRTSLLRSCLELARYDPSARVRARAIYVLQHLVRSDHEYGELKALLAELTDRRTALERRVIVLAARKCEHAQSSRSVQKAAELADQADP